MEIMSYYPLLPHKRERERKEREKEREREFGLWTPLYSLSFGYLAVLLYVSNDFDNRLLSEVLLTCTAGPVKVAV